MNWSNLRNVRAIPGETGAYVVTLDLEDSLGAEYCARPGGGGICDSVLLAITTGAFSGEVSVYGPEPSTVPVTYSKAYLFYAMTDAEYATFETVFAQQPARLRAIFAGASVIETDNPLFPTLEALMIASYGAERTAALLHDALI